MLSCRELSEHYASDHLDRRLPWRGRLAVYLHLMVCTGCRRFMHQLRLVKAVLRMKTGVVLPDKEAKQLAARLHAANQEQQKNFPD